MSATRLAACAVLLVLLTACGSTAPDVDHNAVVRVDVVPATATLFLGTSNVILLGAVPRNSAGVELTGKAANWRSSSTGVATVSAGGEVTAVSLGITQVIATIEGVDGSATVTVASPPVATVTASLGAPVLVAGGLTTVVPVVRDAGGHVLTDRTVTFASSNPGVASVTTGGAVTAISEGTTTITATSETKSSAVALCVLSAPTNFRLEKVVLTQAVQNAAGDLPLVSGGLPAEARVYATRGTAVPAGCPAARVQLIAYDGSTEVAREEVDVTTNLPAAVDDALPVARIVVAGDRIRPSLRVLVRIDPHDVFPESSDSDNAWPPTGTPAVITVVTVPVLELRFVPVLLTNGGTVGLVEPGTMSEYLYATRQWYPISEVDTDIGTTMSTSAAFGSGEQGPWVQILGELDVKRVIEGSRRYYIGALRPPPGVTFTQFGGFGYVPGNLASSGPGTRTSVLVGVGWFSRQRQTTELVAHELGHNHGRRHAPCGGAASPDPAYPYAGAAIGTSGTDMYTHSLSGSSPVQVPAFGAFDFMSYCTPAWVSDYTYQALTVARIAAGPVAASVANAQLGAPCECLIVSGTITADAVALNPAFVTRTRVQTPSVAGPWTIDGIGADGGTVFSHAFESFEIDHAPGIRHFAFALPVSRADRESLDRLRVRGPRGSATLERRIPIDAVLSRLAASKMTLRSAPDGSTRLSWAVGTIRGVLVRHHVSGDVFGISTTGQLELPPGVAEADVTLSDGVRSETVRVRGTN